MENQEYKPDNLDHAAQDAIMNAGLIAEQFAVPEAVVKPLAPEGMETTEKARYQILEKFCDMIRKLPDAQIAVLQNVLGFKNAFSEALVATLKQNDVAEEDMLATTIQIMSDQAYHWMMRIDEIREELDAQEGDASMIPLFETACQGAAIHMLLAQSLVSSTSVIKSKSEGPIEVVDDTE